MKQKTYPLPSTSALQRAPLSTVLAFVAIPALAIVAIGPLLAAQPIGPGTVQTAGSLAAPNGTPGGTPATTPDSAPGGTTAEQPSSISLSPALIAVKAKPGQAFTQELTLWNNTNLKLAFQMEARDVVVRGGKRLFIPAGETDGSIARYVVFNARDVTVLPGSSFTETITVTIPPAPGPRAIVCVFVGKTVVATRASLAMTGSLGALVTFTMDDDFRLQSEPLHVSVDRDARSVTFRQGLTNIGNDPIVPKGVLAVTNESGSLIARLPVSGQRLLPGESLEVSAEHAGIFRSGNYRVVSLMENENAFLSNSTAFTIK